MTLFPQYLYVLGSFQGMLLASLLFFDSRTTNANRILGLWCIFLALSFMASFIKDHQELSLPISVLSWFYFLPSSYGALLFLYCRHAMVDQPFRFNDLRHFIPLLICYSLNFSLFLTEVDSPLLMVEVPQWRPMAVNLVNFVMFTQAFIYWGLSVRLIRQEQHRSVNTLSSFNPEIFGWLWKLLILDLMIWVLKAVGVVVEPGYPFFLAGDVLILVFIYSIAMAQWRNPRVFQIEPLSTTATLSATPMSTPQSEVKEKDSGALAPDTRAELLKLVQAHMEEHESYRDNQLTLTRLAEAVGLSTHHLSEVLNQHEGKNFYQFVNEYRINYIRKQLQNNPSAKILDVALDAGFASKSTFNAVFKQFTGVTPSHYRDKLVPPQNHSET